VNNVMILVGIPSTSQLAVLGVFIIAAGALFLVVTLEPGGEAESAVRTLLREDAREAARLSRRAGGEGETGFRAPTVVPKACKNCPALKKSAAGVVEAAPSTV